MRQVNLISFIKENLRIATCRYAIYVFLVLPVFIQAQVNDSTQSETIVEEEPEDNIISPTIELISTQKGDNSVELKAILKAKIKGTFKKLPLLKVTFFAINGDEQKELGFVITDSEGRAALNAKVGTFNTDTDGMITFKAQFAGNKMMEVTEEQISFKKAGILLNSMKEDSILSISAVITDRSTEINFPLPEVVLGVYVRRYFYPLKIGEITTDENGSGSIEVPPNLPGDASGNITIFTKLEDDEIYGNVEASVAVPWGSVVSDQLHELPRALWSSHPPIWMIITFVVLMLTVWGHYVVIVFELFRLRNEPK